MLVKFLLDAPSLPRYPPVVSIPHPERGDLSPEHGGVHGRTPLRIVRRPAGSVRGLSSVPARAGGAAPYRVGENPGHELAQHLLVQVVHLRQEPRARTPI